MEKIFFIDMNALLPALFWGNLISVLFLVIYHSKNKFSKDKYISLFLILARLLHAFHYYAVSGRGILPDWLSVNVGIVALYIGFYFEALSILRIIRENTKLTDRFLLAVSLGFSIALNLVEFIAPYGGIRIVMASLGVVVIMALPNLRMLLSRDAGIYTKPAAALYSVFLLLNLVRIWYGFNNRDMGILTTNILQSITFLSMLLQLMIALPCYTLIIKSYTDEAVLLMATTDRLTGLTNRYAFLAAATAVYKNCRRYNLSLSALFMDIDYFKQINDNYGHAFGDRVLKRFAVLIDKGLRDSDLSCRYGGEEFVVLLSNSDSEAAKIAAERILNEIRETRFEEYPDFSFTVSIGITSVIPTSDSDIEHIIKLSDEAMYKAKKEGRDRIVINEANIFSV